MLPANMTLNGASSGFRNQGQFIAAVHVSQNLGIPFADLRAAMLGLPRARYDDDVDDHHIDPTEPGTGHSSSCGRWRMLQPRRRTPRRRPGPISDDYDRHDTTGTTTTGTTTTTSRTTATKTSKKKSD